MSRGRVDLNLDAAGRGRILVNGTDVSNMAVGVSLVSRAGDMTQVVLEIPPEAVSVSLDGSDVTISTALADLLVELGWTRPGGAS